MDNTHNHPETGEGIPHADQKGLDLFAYEGMAGVVEYVPWNALEPSQGEYRFDSVLGLIRHARKRQRKLALGVICGSHVPDWYKQRHPEQVFTYRVIRERSDLGVIDRPTDTVLPWVPDASGRDLVLNTEYFDAFFRMLEALAAQVEAWGMTDSLMYVAVTGPGGGNGLEVQWSMPLYNDWLRFDFDERKQEIWVQAWAHCAQGIGRCFPNTPLALAITDQYGAQPGSTVGKPLVARNLPLSQRVLAAVMAGQKPATQRVYPMGLWLSHWNRWGADGHPLCRALEEWRDAGFKIGLQGHMIRHPDLQALEEGTIQKGIEAGASWIEIWHKDIFKDGFAAVPPKYAGHFSPNPMR